MLVVPSDDVLALGTSDPQADVAQQILAPPGSPASSLEPAEQLVQGELLTLDSPADRLARLDALEDFVPGRASLYLRALVLLVDPPGEVAWTYIAPQGIPPADARPIIRWPER